MTLKKMSKAAVMIPQKKSKFKETNKLYLVSRTSGLQGHNRCKLYKTKTSYLNLIISSKNLLRKSLNRNKNQMMLLCLIISRTKSLLKLQFKTYHFRLIMTLVAIFKRWKNKPTQMSKWKTLFLK